MRVVHPHSPEDLQIVLPVESNHHLQRVQTSRNEVRRDIVGQPALFSREDFTHVGVVREERETARGRVSDGVHLRAQQLGRAGRKEYLD